MAYHLIQHVSRQGQQAGVFVELEPHLVEFALMGMCNWRWYDPNGPENMDAVAETFTRIMLRSIPSSEPTASDKRPDVARHVAAIREHADALATALNR